MKKRIKANLLEINIHTVIGFFIVVFVIKIVIGGAAWLYEGLLPVTSYYVYNNVSPVQTAFYAGEMPRFITDAEYFKNIHVRWEDTLWCEQHGFIEKYKTQYWPDDGTELKVAGYKTLTNDMQTLPVWAYYVEPVSEYATRCQLRWKVIGTTLHGWEKVTIGDTVWFDVNY